MPRDERLLYVRAADVGKTYVGGAFCPDEGDFRGQFESLMPEQAFAISYTRARVQSRELSPAEGIEYLSGHDSFARTKAFSAREQAAPRHRFLAGYVERCLATIATGQCLAYPPIEASDGTAI